jgi:leucyl-tRNA synthetase
LVRRAFERGWLLQVVGPPDSSEVELPYTNAGVSVNSSSDAISISGKATEEAASDVIAWLESAGLGGKQVNYKLRDWLFARQRYWGEPFPVVYPEGSDEVIPVPEDQLPVELPEMEEFKPSGAPESPLVNATEWLHTSIPGNGARARRDTNTMPQWAGSCWYYLRFIDPNNDSRYFHTLLVGASRVIECA